MNIALVSPPIQDFYSTRHRLSALGLYTLQEIISCSGHITEIFNFPQQSRYGKKLPLPKSLDYLVPYLSDFEKGPLRFFSHWHHFGFSIDECCEQILHFQPDICFISCLAFAYGDTFLMLAEQIKKYEIPLIAGGAGVSVLPSYFEKSGLFDFIFTGEAESLSDALKKSQTSTQLINEIRKINAMPENTPVPVLSLSVRKDKIIGTTMLTRGCPKRCRFCSNHLTQGKKLRIPSRQSTELLIGKCKTLTHLNIEDDNLLLSKDYFFDFIQSVRKLNPEIGFSAENGLDYSRLNIADVDFLVNNGFRQFNFSLAVIKHQDKENRFFDMDKLNNILIHIHKSEISVYLYFIAGLEHDDPVSLVEFLADCLQLDATMGISLFYPVPGLPGFDTNRNWSFADQMRCRGSAAWPWNSSLTTQELITAFRLTRLVNFIKASPKEGSRHLKEMIKRDQFLSIHKKTGEVFPIENLSGPMLSTFFEKTENLSHCW